MKNKHQYLNNALFIHQLLFIEMKDDCKYLLLLIFCSLILALVTKKIQMYEL